MRQIQRQSRQREAEAQKPVKGLWQSEKYKDVPSKVRSDFEVCRLPCLPDIFKPLDQVLVCSVCTTPARADMKKEGSIIGMLELLKYLHVA